MFYYLGWTESREAEIVISVPQGAPGVQGFPGEPGEFGQRVRALFQIPHVQKLSSALCLFDIK